MRPLGSTERLVVRRWRIDEAERLLAIRSDPAIAQWLADPTPWISLDQAVEAITAWQHGVDGDDRLGSWAIVPVDADRPVGTVSLKPLPNDTLVEIGWNLHPDSTGRGYAREAAALVLAHAERHRILPVHAVMWPHNDRSAAVCLAIGMTDLGIIDDPWYGTEDEPTSRIFRYDG